MRLFEDVFTTDILLTSVQNAAGQFLHVIDLAVGDEVAIHLERDRGILMAQQFAHDGNGNILRQKQRSETVAQAMEGQSADLRCDDCLIENDHCDSTVRQVSFNGGEH